MAAMSEADLKALLDAAKSDALSGESASKLVTERADAMDYYMGDMSKDMPTQDGRSRAVSTDVADTVEGLMPSLMEIFCGSDEVVRFEPVGPEDVDAAEQETDYVNHVFMQQNPGFLVLYSFIKDALLSKVGIVKVYPEEKEEEERKTYYDQPADAFAIISSEPDIEIIAHTENDDGYGGKLHDVQVSCKKTYSRCRVDPVPPEEFGISRNARNIREADYCFHEVKRSESDLIKEGYDPAQVRSLPSYASPGKAEETARDTIEESSESRGEDFNKAMRLIRVTEHYIRMDYEGDGKARLYRVTTGGEQGDVLRRNDQPDVAEEDMIRFAAMTPVIMTHRFFGRSIADLVMDIQRIKTALLRALLDNAYLANNPRVEVAEAHSGPDTLDDLLVSRPGGIVRTKTPGGLQWQIVPTIGNHVFPLIEYADMQKEFRTGVTRQGQGIDADALQNQSATAVNQLYSASQARVKLIARIFAETGIKDLFWLLHATIRKHGKQAETVRLRNRWVTVDPRQFKTRTDLTVNVGLGSGGKSERIAQLMAMMNIQKEALAAGLVELVSPKNIYNSSKEFTKLIELKNHEAFFTDPESEEGQQAAANKPEDPKVAEARGKLELEGKKAQANVQLDQAKMAAQAQMDAARLEQEGLIKREQMSAEFALRREQMLAEFQLRREEMVMEAEIKREAARMNAAAKVESSKSDGITDTQMGGDVG